MMRTNSPKIFFISLGCDKNRVDSEKMMGLLSDSGFSFTDDEHEAEIIIINSCCFIDSAKEETIETVLEMAKMKEAGACKCLIMAGCMSERYAEEVLHELPEVDALVGISDLSKIVTVIARFFHTEDSSAGKGADDAAKPSLTDINSKRILTTGGHYAYLKIADGCDRRCTYCIIPSIRGHYKSYPMDDLLIQAKNLADSGVKEIILVAQETTLYGTDIYGKRLLPELLKRISMIDGLRWIRLLYTYPEEITDELIYVIADERKICNYIDMPIQHASDRILKRMGRSVTQSDITELIGKIRGIIPDITLRTSLISGFPGETDEDHRLLMDFVGKAEFDRLGVFTYSREEGTPAALMPNQIAEDVKEQRADEIMKFQMEISRKKLLRQIGRQFDVFIEGRLPGENVYAGRTYMDAPDVDACFFVESDNELLTGDFVRAVATGSGDYDLCGAQI